MKEKRFLGGVFLLGIMLGMLHACTGTFGAYKTAESLELQVYVMAEHYDIVLDQVATYVERPDASPTAKARLQSLVRAGEPVFSELEEARAAYGEIKSVETEEALAEALNKAVLQLTKVVEAMRGVL